MDTLNNPTNPRMQKKETKKSKRRIKTRLEEEGIGQSLLSPAQVWSKREEGLSATNGMGSEEGLLLTTGIPLNFNSTTWRW